MHVAKARLKAGRQFAARAGYSCGFALLLFLFGSRALQNAVAEGDTRTITMHHIHTGEDITITYKRDGRYDDAALKKLDWFLRDWRRGESTEMDPRLIDLVWEVQREAGSKEPIQVVCGYRSPTTNAMLRRRSEGVARYSQHILGRAMDFYVPGVSLEQVREIGLRLARGGVGFYPESGSPFVHMDVGGIRMWPRMTREQLERVFPDGRTVQIPTDGKPLAGYALALAEATKRGAAPSANSLQAARNAGVDVDTVLASNEHPAGTNPFAKLLGLARDDEDEADAKLTPVAWHPPPLALAGLDPKTEKKPAIGSAMKTKVASAIAKLKLVHIAKLLPAPATPAAAEKSPASPPHQIPAASATTPNQVILARGYWEGPPDGMAVANPLAEIAYRRSETADADQENTGTIDRGNGGGNGNGLALAFADPRDSAAGVTESGIAALRAAALAARQQIPAKTTIAVKRAADQVASAIVTASASSMMVIKSGVHVADPWLRAIVLSPSVKRFLTTVALGDRDFRSLAALMIKPKSAVKMTFAADPNPGLSQDRFSGAAIAFVPTINYATQTHTASLR
ncbi:MAG TPA: DUF882 domain-containing protein [Xanthobacteraceae bacterium]|nr:DUF882 domain-containing protein [Xanthobacteraceae bacterium]